MGQAPRRTVRKLPRRPLNDVLPTLDNITTMAAFEAARYAALCSDLDDVMESANIRVADIATPKPHSLPASFSLPPPTMMEPDPRTTGRLLDLAGNSISLKQELDYGIEWQSQAGTGTKSERSVKVNFTYYGT